MIVAIVFAIVLGAVTLVMYWQWRGHPFIQYTAVLRFEILAAVALMVLPLTHTSALLGNLFHLESPYDLAMVVMLTLLASWQVMVMTLLVLTRAATQVGVRAIAVPAWIFTWRVPLFGVLGSAMSFVLLRKSDSLGWGLASLGLGSGVAAALGILWCTTLVQQRLTSPLPDDAPQFLLPPWIVPKRLVPKRVRRTKPPLTFQPPSWAGRVFGPGIVAPDGGLQNGAGVAVALLLVSSLLYMLGYVALYPLYDLPTRLGWLSGIIALPALAYLLVLLIAVGWALMLGAFWLDRFRIPVTLVLLATACLGFLVHDQDHVYPLVSRPQGAADPIGPIEGLRLARRPATAGKTVAVVVAAAGGGISAAAWTAAVLTRLHQETDAFAPSIRLISGVSGGSVGAMYFIDAFTPKGLPQTEAVANAIYKNAASSTLTATAWGFVYPDLWRLTLVPIPVSSQEDRAWLMEQVWQRALRPVGPNRPAPTLSDWIADTRAGWRPPVIFNATAVESGRRIVFGTAAVADRGVEMPPGVSDFWRESSRQEVRIATAVRLSATFPYVSPVARPDDRARDVQIGDHLADGGYHDNFGLATVIDWLSVVLPRAGNTLDGIVLIQIQLEPPAITVPSSRPRPGIFYEIVGPISTIVDVRMATQISRNQVALELLRRAYPQIPICSVIFPLVDGTPTSANPPSSGDPVTLSWHLTNPQRESIRSTLGGAANPGRVKLVKRWLEGEDLQPCKYSARLGK